MVSYYRPIVTLCVKCTVFEIFAFYNYRDLETRVRGHSRSSKVTPFDSLHMVSYYRPIVTLCLKCTVFEMTTYWWKIVEKPKPPSFDTIFGGDPLRIFLRVIPSQKLESDGVHFTILLSLC